MPPAASFVKIREPSVEILGRFPLSAAARDAVDPTQTPDRLLAALVAAGCDADAARFLAFALPKRESVWWACLCVRATLPEPADAAEEAALAAAEAWVYQPGEESRRAAMAAAEAAGLSAPASWCGMAAFWSGGSMAPVEAPVVPPGESLTGRAVAGAVLLSVGRRGPLAVEGWWRAFLAWGVDIAKGGRGRDDAAGAHRSGEG